LEGQMRDLLWGIWCKIP